MSRRARAGSEKLLLLAETQRMNTDLRRRIFVAMMGADDYVDAHTRLVKLRLTKGQQPEMVRVLLECCGQEGIFNRYYALLGARLCETFREFRFALQFAFWDAFKTLGELTLHRTANTAKLLAQLIQRDAVPLACLKVVGWSRPSERAVFFWQVFFIELLGAPPAAMQRIYHTFGEPTNGELKDGVLLFLERHVQRMVAKQHAAVAPALQKLFKSIDGAA